MDDRDRGWVKAARQQPVGRQVGGWGVKEEEEVLFNR